MTRPDDLDRAEERVAVARARLNESAGALQTQLQPRALAQSLLDEAAERRRALTIGAASVAGVAGAATLVVRMLRRRRSAHAADPAAHAKRVTPAAAKSTRGPRIRFRAKRKTS